MAGTQSTGAGRRMLEREYSMQAGDRQQPDDARLGVVEDELPPGLPRPPMSTHQDPETRYVDRLDLRSVEDDLLVHRRIDGYLQGIPDIGRRSDVDPVRQYHVRWAHCPSTPGAGGRYTLVT